MPAARNNNNADNLVWIDLEMTGLDPYDDVILQAAVVITTADLEPLSELAIDVLQPEEALALDRYLHSRCVREIAGTDRT